MHLTHGVIYGSGQNKNTYTDTYKRMTKYVATHILHHTDVQTITKTHAVYYIHIHHPNMIQKQLNSLDAPILGLILSVCLGIFAFILHCYNDITLDSLKK